jgi:L-aspartate oxidase
MSDYVGIIRTHERLHRASKRLNVLFEETEDLYQKSKLSTSLFELRNMISTAYLIVEQSMKRVENKGGFYNSDLI